MKYVVDRIEESKVVLVSDEDEIIEVDRSEIDGDVKENDVIERVEDKWKKNVLETEERLEYMKRLMEDMWKN